jgi:hypothetical protein
MEIQKLVLISMNGQGTGVRHPIKQFPKSPDEIQRVTSPRGTVGHVSHGEAIPVDFHQVERKFCFHQHNIF